MDLEKIQAQRDAQAAEARRQESLAATISVGDKIDKSLAFQTAKLIANSKKTAKVSVAEPMASPQDIQDVVATLNKLGASLAPKDLKPVVDALGKVLSEVSKLPKQYPEFPAFPEFPQFPDFPKDTKVNNLAEIKPWLEAVVAAVGKIELQPKIDVAPADVQITEQKLDTTPITKELEKLGKTLKGVATPAADFTKLIAAVNKTTQTIGSLSFPAPNYVIPFKDVQGRGTQVQLDANGNVPVVASASVPSAIVAFRTTVTTAGTRVQLGTNTVSGVVIQAPSTNTGLIYVGGSNVSSTVFGAELQPGQSTGLAIDNTNKIYIDASVNGDKCAVLGS